MGWKGRLKFTDKKGWLWGGGETLNKNVVPRGQRSKKLPLSPPLFSPWNMKKKGGKGWTERRRRCRHFEGIFRKEREKERSFLPNLFLLGWSWRVIKKTRDILFLFLSLSLEKRRGGGSAGEEGVDSVCQAKTGVTEDSCQPLNYSANSIERLGNWSQVGANKLPVPPFNNLTNSICLLSIRKHAFLLSDIPVVILWNCCNFVSANASMIML